MIKQPRVLLLDIETSPLKIFAWGVYDVNALKVIESSKLMSCAWKFLGIDKNVNVKALCDYPSYKPGVLDDRELVLDIWKVLDEADVVVAHNGTAFDVKKLNTRFVAHGLTAPSEYKQVDTLKVAKKYFKFEANGLNALGVYLEEGEKVANGGFETWVKCMDGDPKAWIKMKKYNGQDVNLLENVYLRLRPYQDDHPNLNLIANIHDHSCQTCMSKNTIKRGFSLTRTGRKQRFQCTDCGSWSTGPFQKVQPGEDDKE